MIKIGIISRYYSSTNYGGLLQAYALCKYINALSDVYAEQISYNSKNVSLNSSFVKLKEASFKKRTVKALKKIKTVCIHQATKLFINKSVCKRGEALKQFRESIPHSKEVYDDQSINQTVDIYDIFITGSDRVWHPQRTNSAFYLTFAGDKVKASYAASLAANKLSVEQKNDFSEIFKTFSAISVRESETVDILQSLTEKKNRMGGRSYIFIKKRGMG